MKAETAASDALEMVAMQQERKKEVQLLLLRTTTMMTAMGLQTEAG